MNDIEKRIKINGVKNGFILGLIITALSIASYYLITTTASPLVFVGAPVIFSVFIPIFSVIFLAFKARKDIGGYWTFKQATTGIFIMFLVAFVFNYLGKEIIFNKFVEPDNTVKVQTAAINAKIAILKERHTSQALIDKNVAELKKDFSQPSASIGNAITGVVISIIFVFILALLFGALFKKDPPVYVQQG
ncbi:MAG: DUF4199 domain-containing protein [Mucilaginibacter sp.]